MGKKNTAKLRLIAAMAIFGTVGLFRRYIPFGSGAVALARAVIGILFLLILQRIKKRPMNRKAIKKNLPILVASGVVMAINWILLFEAYNYTTVSAATVCYYMAPMLVVVFAPLILKEKMRPYKLVCAALAVVGIVLVSGVLTDGLSGGIGIALGLGAAVFYAGVMFLNRFLRDIGAYDRTIGQLAAAAIVLIPYTLLTEPMPAQLDASAVLMTLVVGVVHTGFAYSLYFGSMDYVPAQALALFSYIDPVVAVLLSALVLHEPLTLLNALGVVLVLGSAAAGELIGEKKR